MGVPKSWTLSELIAAVRSEIGEAPETYITQVEVIRWLNMGLVDFTERTRILRTAATMPTVIGQKKYVPPDDFSVMEKVFWDGDELEPLNDHELLFDVKRENLDNQGNPQSYYIRGASESPQCIFLHPVPAAIRTLELWYVSVPDEMGKLTDVLDAFLHPQFANALIYYAAERGQRKKRQLQEARDLRVLYEEQISRAETLRHQWTLDRPQYVIDEMAWAQKATRRTW
jgi:hypothetical protein